MKFHLWVPLTKIEFSFNRRTNNHNKNSGIELLPHPPYSPDLAPSDYLLFLSMTHLLRGRNFENIEAVEVDLAEFFASKKPEIGTVAG